MTQSKASDNSLVRSLDRGLKILDSFIVHHRQTLNQVSTDVDLPKSTTFRLLATLESSGYVNSVSGESGTYQIGIKGIWFTSERNLIHQELEGLQSLTSETVNFGAIVGNEVEYVDRILSDHALRWGVDIGSRIPMHASGMGKAILAFRKDLLADPLPLDKRTEQTITDVSELKKQFKIIKENGFAFDDEEFIEGVICIAAPIFNKFENVIGAVSISGPAVRFTKEVASNHTKDLIKAANRISEILGYQNKQ